MTVRFGGFLPIVGLMVLACLQGCATSPPAAKTGPAPAQQPNTKEVVPAPAPQPTYPAPAPSQTAPLAEAEKSPPSIMTPATEPVPVAVVPPVVTAKPDASKPVEKVEAKPAAKAEPPPAATKPVPSPAAKPSPQRQSPQQPAATKPAETPLAVIPAPTGLHNKPDVESERVPETPEVVEPDVVVTLEALPLTIRGEWVLSASGDVCTLSTLPVQFDDGQGMSKLQLIFTAQQWLIKTQSDIDLTYSGTGLTVDEDRHFPLEQLVRESDLRFTKEYAAMTEAFMAGKNLRITLGFWPTWPVTETKTVTVPLQGFASAHRAWKQCLLLINGH